MANLTLTRQWVENIYQLETSDPVMGGPDGIDNRQAKELGARTNWLKDQVDTVNRDRAGYAPKASPAFTGTPTAPTANQNTSNTQVATTEFVKNAIAALVGSAPAALDTLEELARALAGDANLKATLLAEIGKKANATDFNALHDLFVGIPIPYPLSTVPTGCLAMNGQRFDARRYPKLAQKYPSGVLPDLRGEFIRGWDNGRGIDNDRTVLSSQGDAIRNIKAGSPVGSYKGWIANGDAKQGDTNGAIRINSNGARTLINGTENHPSGNLNWIFWDFDASRTVPTANENRPRNIAYHYICLAA